MERKKPQSILKVSKNQLLRLRQEYNLIFLLAIHKGYTKKEEVYSQTKYTTAPLPFFLQY